MKHEFNIKKAKKELDILWSLAVRSVGKCERCGSVRTLQAAHIFSRGNLTTRWEISNGICLCYPCHIHWGHHQPIEFALWVQQKIGQKVFNELRRKSQKIYDSSDLKADYEKIKKQLT